MIYLSPRPSKSSLKECYPDTYYTSKKSDKFNLSKKLFERRYLNRLNRFSKATNKQPKSLFEVGYGDGSFLTFLKSKWENNCDLSGIDFKLPKMSHHLDGINLFEGDFSTIKLNQTFDVIVMYQVLEHLQDPLTICKELHSMLKEDGILVIEVPNWDSLWRKVFSQHWSGLQIPRHQIFFSPKTLQQLLDKAGFKTKDFNLVFDPGDLSVSLCNFLADKLKLKTSPRLLWFYIPIALLSAPIVILQNLILKNSGSMEIIVFKK